MVTDYRKDPGSSFWDGFPANKSRVAKSLVSPVKPVKVILNLLAGRSVNDSIDASEFLTVMSSTGEWL